MNLKTTGVVIKRSNFGEADRILTIFTERFGKIKAFAKGVRKTKSKLAGHLEPFMLVDLMLHEGRTFYTVTGAVIEKDFPNIHSDLSKMAKAFVISELVDSFLGEKEQQEKIFTLYVDSLKTLENYSREINFLAFEMKIIGLAGFRPELYYCVHCKEKVREEENFWDRKEGGVICGSCQKNFKHGKTVSNNLIKLLRFVEKANFNEIDKLKLSNEIEAEADGILSEYISHILEKELKSERFMKVLENEDKQ